MGGRYEVETFAQDIDERNWEFSGLLNSDSLNLRASD